MENKWIRGASVLCFFLFLALLLSISFSSDGWVRNWSGSALRGFGVYSLVFFAVSGIFYRLNKNYAARALVLSVGFFLLVALGFNQVFAVVILFFSVYCFGQLLFRVIEQKFSGGRVAESFIVGLALYVLGFSLLSGTSYNSREIYLFILSLPIFMHMLHGSSKGGLSFYAVYYKKFIVGLDSLHFRSLAFAAFIFLYVCAHSFFPTVMWDDNVMHLSWWTQLENHHTYKPDVVAQIWSVAPFAIDLLHAIASIIAGADARGALNTVIFVLMAFSFYRLAGFIDGDRSRRLLVLTLFITTPMAANLMLGLQTDLIMAFIAILGGVIIYKLNEEFSILGVLALFAVGAIFAAIKLPAILIGLGFLIAAMPLVYQHRQSFFSERLAGAAKYSLVFLLIVAAAFYPYINAYIETKNPVFPLYNGVFKSEYFEPKNFIDLNYSKGVSLNSLWGMFFHTPSYFESKNYTAGFQYLFLFPLALLILLVAKPKKIYFILIPLFLYAVPMFFTLQYVRYFYAIMPLMSIVLLVLLRVGDAEERLYQKIARYSFVGFVWVNMFFLPGVSWNFSVSPFVFLNTQAKDAFANEGAPELQLNKEINKINKNAKVLFDLSRPYGATLAGTPLYNAWYSPTYSKEILAWSDIASVKKTIDEWKVDYIYWNSSIPFSGKNVTRNILASYLNEYGYAEKKVGALVAFKPADTPIVYQDILSVGRFDELKSFEVVGAPRLTDKAQVELHPNDILMRSFSVKSFHQFKYHVEFECAGSSEAFIAQVNWSLGEPYYKLVECSSDKVIFDEVGLIPQGATVATLYLSLRGGGVVTVNNIVIGLR